MIVKDNVGISLDVGYSRRTTANSFGVYARMKVKRKSYLFAAVLLLFSGIALLTYGFLLRRDASKIIGDVEAFAAAGEKDQAFQTLQLEYGSHMRKMPGCIPSRCSYELDVNNRLYSILHLSPYTDLNVRFDRKGDEHLVMITYSIGNNIFLHVQTASCLGRHCPSFYINPWQNVVTAERWNGIVELESAASPKLRRAAFAINTGCLTKIWRMCRHRGNAAHRLAASFRRSNQVHHFQSNWRRC
ncbi:MAG: hypothetical protein JWO13_2050 [Acidobacteriales bacterium]|nr:hypothetical protein [Terriglobales bacterium]